MTTSYSLDPEMRRRLWLLFASSSFILTSVLLRWLRPDQPGISGTFALVGAVLIALPILYDTITSIRSTGFEATQFYMDQYVLLALAACLGTGRYVTGGIVAIILVFGQMIEERTVIGVEFALAKLRNLTRVRATRINEDGSEEEIDSAELSMGDSVRIRPGDSIPADGVVLSGEAMVDQSSITGESVPVEVSEGFKIFAGTTNLNGLLEAKVTGSGEKTILGRVQEIVEEAKNSEAPIMRMTEDYARYYTPLILLIAASVFFFTRDIERAISVLVVAIPCAFVLASPSAMVSAIASASRLGLLIKGTRHLEMGRLIDTVVFDKTGTLTQGKLAVEETRLHSGWSDEPAAKLLAAALENHSKHPVAAALVAAAEGADLPEVTGLEEVSGKGLKGTIGRSKVLIGRQAWLEGEGVKLVKEDPGCFSLVSMAIDGLHVADFLLADQVRPEAKEAIERFRSLGITDFLMLTGDRKPVAEAIAKAVGITEFQAECLPEDKLSRIRALREKGHKVMVVGDGLNDAPALAEGDLGVAMGALGNEVAIHTADVALMSHDLRRLPDLILLSAKTVGTINQNLLCGFIFIIAAIIFSSLGHVNPIAAAFFHEFSAFFVIFNSARLLRFDGIQEHEPSITSTTENSHAHQVPEPA
ncbi:heavy metal translocating P-type ATPase [Luteolibacter algae]|uniref:P-type Zn(2+) transporter n=1 Tax=Luteolibacter algae TaxID=454151 RepID=A0ABW5D4R2_9BACT